MTNIFTAESFGSDLPENWEDICSILNDYAESHPDEDPNEIWEDYWQGKLDRYYVEFGDHGIFRVNRCDNHDTVYTGQLFADCGIVDEDPEYTNKLDSFLESELGIKPEQWEVG